MKKIVSSVFFHELKNSLTSIRFGIEIFGKYEMKPEEKKQAVQDVLTTVDNTVAILEEYMQFIKFQFTKKLSYENVNLYTILDEIVKEVTPFAKEKSIKIYIKKTDVSLYTNKFWLKRAIYNVIFNAIKYNKEYGTVSIKIEKSSFGIYLSITDTGMGISNKKLKSIFKTFETINEDNKGMGIGLALAKSIIESLGGDIHVESNENIGSDFIFYIPNKPKEVTLKRIALSIVPASIVLFLTLSYFPIYSQKIIKNTNGGYTTYTLEDGSVLKFSQNSEYELEAKKNLYNTKLILNTKLKQGDMSLKAIENKATILVDNKKFKNLGTDFEVMKDKFTKVVVFDGKVKSDALLVERGQGVVVSKKIKVIKLLSPLESVTIINNYLKFKPNPKATKYKVLIATNKEFSNIENSFYTTNTNIKLDFTKDTLYYIKLFSYDKYGLPSLPKVIKYVSLTHYNKAIRLLNINTSEAILELESSVNTIKNYSPLPYYKLAQILFLKKEYTKALKYINQAIKIDDKKEYYYLMFDIYQKLNQTKKIEELLDEVLKKYPNDIRFLFFKAQILYNNKQYKKANKILFKVLQKNPKYKKANLLMSKVLKKLGKIESSKYYERLAK